MKRFYYIFFASLLLFTFKANAQCDYYNSVTVSTSGYHTAAGYVQEYVFVDDLTDVIVEVNTTGVFTPAFSGLYRIYAVNYLSPAPAALSPGNLWADVETYASTNCMDILGPYTGSAVSICEEMCELDDIVVSTTGYYTAAAFQQIYVLVDDAGNIIDSNSTGTFTGLMAGVYYVYAVNTEETDVINEINDLGPWADIPVMSPTYCLDIIGPQAFDLIPTITPLFDPVGPYCVGDTPDALPGTSTNGVTGTWSPATISTASDGTTTYTFTPDAGECATTATMDVVVNICCPTTTCPPDLDLTTCNDPLPAGATTLAEYTAQGGTYTDATDVSFSDATVNGCSTVTTRTYSISNATCTVTCDQIITRVVDVTNPTGTCHCHYR